MYNKVATFENADRVRQNPPVAQLQKLMREVKTGPAHVGTSVIYWMRMQDMRRELDAKFFPRKKDD
jgi:hypothetical protein